MLADPLSPAACRPAARACERRGLRYLLALNCPAGGRAPDPAAARAAAGLGPGVPVVVCDAADRTSATLVLIFLLGHVLRAEADALLAGDGPAGPAGRRWAARARRSLAAAAGWSVR